jgi:hypothetical protein
MGVGVAGGGVVVAEAGLAAAPVAAPVPVAGAVVIEIE